MDILIRLDNSRIVEGESLKIVGTVFLIMDNVQLLKFTTTHIFNQISIETVNKKNFTILNRL